MPLADVSRLMQELRQSWLIENFPHKLQIPRAWDDKRKCLERAKEDWDGCREKAGKTLTGCAVVCAGLGLASGGTALNICLAACILNYTLERQKCDDDYDKAKRRCKEDYEKAKERAIEDNPIPPKPESHDY